MECVVLRTKHTHIHTHRLSPQTNHNKHSGPHVLVPDSHEPPTSQGSWFIAHKVIKKGTWVRRIYGTFPLFIKWYNIKITIQNSRREVISTKSGAQSLLFQDPTNWVVGVLNPAYPVNNCLLNNCFKKYGWSHVAKESDEVWERKKKKNQIKTWNSKIYKNMKFYDFPGRFIFNLGKRKKCFFDEF